MSRKPRSTPSRPEMVKAVDEMLKNLEKLAPDPGIVSTCPELPGIVLDRPERSLRSRREPYNCHHVIPKSLQVTGGSAAINHPANLVMAKTVRRGRDQSQNPHHCWHALLLHPQTHNAPPTSIPVYVVRPLFPFYPPTTQGFRSAEELRAKLKALGAPPLPEIWEKRILEFSKAAKHKAYCVPREFHEITEMFGDLYRPENKDPANNLAARRALAERSAKQAADWLPSGAFLNGSPLPPSHRPKKCLPIVQSTTAPALSPPQESKPAQKKPRRRTSPEQRIVQEPTAKV